MNLRTETDRRKASPFGTNGPWLTMGKMGGLVLTERRKTIRRRASDKQQERGVSGVMD